MCAQEGTQDEIGHNRAAHQPVHIQKHTLPPHGLKHALDNIVIFLQMKRLSKAELKGIRISTESQEMGIYKSFNYEIFERRNSVLLAFDGNSSIANLVQEARNGKGRSWIFVHPKSVMLKAKAASLDGYVTINATPTEVISKIQELQDNIGTKR